MPFVTAGYSKSHAKYVTIQWFKPTMTTTQSLSKSVGYASLTTTNTTFKSAVRLCLLSYNQEESPKLPRFAFLHQKNERKPKPLHRFKVDNSPPPTREECDRWIDDNFDMP
jgi:hypothetical protein